jgi:hypothetical protein
MKILSTLATVVMMKLASQQIADAKDKKELSTGPVTIHSGFAISGVYNGPSRRLIWDAYTHNDTTSGESVILPKRILPSLTYYADWAFENPDSGVVKMTFGGGVEFTPIIYPNTQYSMSDDAGKVLKVSGEVYQFKPFFRVGFILDKLNKLTGYFRFAYGFATGNLRTEQYSKDNKVDGQTIAGSTKGRLENEIEAALEFKYQFGDCNIPVRLGYSNSSVISIGFGVDLH